MVLIVMADTSPAAVFFGDETTIIYNEPFSHLIGSSHPALQGQSPKSGFAEIWGQFEDLIAAARNGTVTGHRIKPLLLYRNGFLEETYFSWKIIALVGNGGISGFYATAMEVTLERIAERRASTIRNLGRQVASTHEIRDLCTQILRGLEQNEKDIPLALYSLREDDETVQPQGGNVFQLETALGIDPGHALIPRSLNLQVNTNGLAMAFKRSTLSNNQAILSIEDDSLPPDQIRGIQRRSFGACTAIIVCPLQSIMPVSTLGFRIIELNPQQHYDDAYRRFVETLTKQITTAHVNSLALREEFRAKEAAIQLSTTGLQMLDDRLARRTEFRTSEIRGDSEAAQANLAYAKRFEKLAARAIEFEQREMQTSPSAECAAVGLAILSPAGLVLFANQTYHNLAVYSSESGETSSLMDALEPQDWYNTSRLWKSLLLNKEPLKFQVSKDGLPRYHVSLY
jgi:PAS domain-containing protein